MSAVYEPGVWPDVWTVINVDETPGRLPLLLFPKGYFDGLPLTLQAGATHPTQFEYSDPLALYVDEAGTVRTCILSATNDFAAPTLRIDDSGEPDFGGSIDPEWIDQIRRAGSVLLCGYTDIFLAEHVGESTEPPGEDILRLLRTSMLGILRVLGPAPSSR
ncbi:hypothetical protein [Microbacterium sp. MYb62]|uniref:hypothetical protein n=1 Tax=Microbacterium sp. MYb62 TaxID=1848690 RepID=UPI0011B0DBB1|nr:hypothetical protein [Microbacterium sp. MYb62]